MSALFYRSTRVRFSIAVDSSLVYMACSLTKQKKRYLLYWKQNAAIFLFGLLPHVISFIGIDPYLSSSFFGAPFIPKPAILDTPFIGARLRPLSCKGLSFVLTVIAPYLEPLDLRLGERDCDYHRPLVCYIRHTSDKNGSARERRYNCAR